jgi:5'-AMP-activated protein kinase regulatory beta subunit
LFGQVPVVPLQRPDEMHPPIHHSSSAYEHISTQHTIPTMITWTYGAKLISVQGSWDNWKSRFLNLSLLITSYKIVFTVFVFYILIYLFIRTPLQRSGKDFAIMKVLPSGVYQYRFIVDERFTYDPELPWSKDEAGNFYNILDLKVLIYYYSHPLHVNKIDTMIVNLMNFYVEKRLMLLN